MTLVNAGQHILVLGLGKSGVAAARYCAGLGAQVTVVDDKSETALAPMLAQLRGVAVALYCGRQDLPSLDGVALVVASPGVPPAHPLLQAALAARLPVANELEIAVRACATPLVAVTGTNGKSTTTTLIGAILQAAGERVVVGGNLGTPMLDLLPTLQHAHYGVMEISSYQIETAPSLVPQVAVLLNVTPDHLDRYGTFEAYVAAKQQLVARMPVTSTVIYNATDPVVVAMMCATRAHALPFCVAGGDTPTSSANPRGKQPGAYAADGIVQVRLPNGRHETWDLRAAQLTGVHNQENMVAAGLACALLGVPAAVICAVLTTFTGLPHRCQFVGEWRGVRYYNDSKGTNVGAVVKSLEGFSAPVILLAGGQDKGTGYADLQAMAAQKVKHLVAFGAARGLIAQDLSGTVPVSVVETMEYAVRRAMELAVNGDVVLLSPACASFDQYANYAARGDDFIRWIRQLHDAHLPAAASGGGAW